MKNKHKAFSLIELSIVILIIGVLIAGVTQASRLVRQSKISTAKTLTQSSPVNSIRGLLLWLEPVMDSSFMAAQAVDNTNITKWYDLNPQLSIPNTVSVSSTATIKYKASSVTNSLPAVVFDANNPGLVGNVFDGAFSSFTIFAVVRPTTAGSNTIFYDGSSGVDGFGLSINSSSKAELNYGTSSTVNNGSGTTTFAASQNSANIISMTIAPNYVAGTGIVASPAVNSYKNGTADISSTITGSNWVNPTTRFIVGNATPTSTTQDFNGEISEIIIFDGVLKISDRQEIERYLGKKYAIQLSQGNT